MDDNSKDGSQSHLPPGGKAVPSDQNKWASGDGSASSTNQGGSQEPQRQLPPGNSSPAIDPTTNQPMGKAPPFPGSREKRDKEVEEETKRQLLSKRPKSETIDFISESRETAYENAPTTVRFTIYFILTIVISALIWAALSDIDITVNSQGKVIPSSHVQVVQNLEGGIISKIYVKEGNIVKKGQTLVEMDDTRFRSEYNEKRAKLNVLESEIIRLKAESEGSEKLDYSPQFERENPELVQHARHLFKQNNAALQKNLAVMQESYDLAKKELDIVTPLTRQGIMSNLEMIRLEREVNGFKGKITELKESHYKQAREELNKITAEHKIVKEQITASRDRMIRTEVKSPVDGIINKLHVTSIGEVVTPDEKILEIVPLDDTLSIQINVPPSKIGFIKKGQHASIKISAYDFAIYGDVKGYVERISSDSIKDEKGEEYYYVTVKADKNYIGNPKDNLTILPGMTVTASITTTKRTVLSYFLKPLFKIRDEAFISR